MTPLMRMIHRFPGGHGAHWRCRALLKTGGRWFLGGKRATERVVLFHVGRSGSTLLGDLLGQHPQFYWDGEIYEDLFQAMEQRRRRPRTAAREIDPLRYLECRMAWPGARLFGFEVKFFHLQFFGVPLADYLGRLEQKGFQNIILLERRNTLRVILSGLIAAHSGQWHLSPGKRCRPMKVMLGRHPIAIDRRRGSLISFLEEYRHSFGHLEELLRGKRFLRLVYEDDLQQNPLIGYHRVCRFLKIPPVNARVRYARTNPFPLSDLVEDIEKMRELIKGTPFEWMGHDDS
jgi:hypothetical protein